MQRLTLRLLLSILLLVAGSLAGCVAVNPGLRLTPAPAADPDSFTADLVGAVVGRNYARLQAMMGSPFVLASWPGSAEELAPEAAVQRLEQELLGPATALTFVTPEVVAQWLGGANPLQLWPADVTPVRALGVSGLGADGAGQAVLIVAVYPDGSYYWYAMLLAPEGFPADGSTPPGLIEVVPTPVMPAILPTDIQQVLILGPVGIFASPNAQSVQVGTAVRGQTFPVIGASADGQWWAVVCPEATTTCWISANPTFVRPVRLPRPQPTSTPRPLPPTPTPLPPTPGPAQPERISFPPGADRAVRSGPLYAATPKQYFFRAEAGQNATVRLASLSSTANFTIVGVSDGFPYKPQGNTARDFTFLVPASQDYMITLFSTVNSSYTLELIIPRLGPTPMPTPERIVFAPGQDSAVRSGVLPGGGSKQYIFNARAGQVATLRLDAPPGSDANFSVRGMLDGVTYKAPTDPAREWSFLLPRTQDYLVTLRASGDTSYVLELVIPPIVGPTPTPIPEAPERISFAPGQQSAVRSGPLYAATPRQYVFRAEAGQTATVLFGSPSPAASFSIVGVEDGIPYKTTGNPAREFTFLIPRSQDYLLTLTAPVNTSYTVELTIPGPVAPTPTPVPSAPERITFAPGTDTAVRSGSLTPGQYKRYVFGAEAGQTATLQLTSPSPAANFTVVGVSDGIPYKSQGNSAIDFTFVLPLTQDYLVSIFAPVNTSYTLRLTIPPLAPPTPTATATILPTVIPPTPVEETPTPTPTLLPTVVPPTATPTETVLPTVVPPTATPTETVPPTAEPPTATPTETPTAIAPIEPEPLPVEPVDPIEPPVP